MQSEKETEVVRADGVGGGIGGRCTDVRAAWRSSSLAEERRAAAGAARPYTSICRPSGLLIFGVEGRAVWPLRVCADRRCGGGSASIVRVTDQLGRLNVAQLGQRRSLPLWHTPSPPLAILPLLLIG